MPLVSAGLYQLELQSTVGSVTGLNVFHYIAANFGNLLEQEIADAFRIATVPAFLPLVHTSVSFTQINVFNLTTLDAGYELPLVGQTGTLVGDPMPSNTACSFRLNRTTRETRNGSKRFGPMNEGASNGNTFVAGYFTDMVNAAAVMIGGLTLSATTASLAIVRKQTTPLPWINITYNPVSSITPLDRLTTQNSRKFFT